MASPLHLFEQMSTVNSSNGRLTGGIDVADGNQIGSLQRVGKLAHQIARAGIAMRLEDSDQSMAGKAGAGSGKCSRNFGRMVTIVIDDHDPCSLAAHRETTADSSKGR